MRRGFITVFLISILLTSLQTQIGVAAIESGAKCTKVGKVGMTAGKQYVCIKKGKSLVWRLSKTQKPSQANTSKSAGLDSSRPRDFKELDFNTAWTIVHRELQQRLKAYQGKTIDLDVENRFGKSISPAIADSLKQTSQLPWQFYSDINLGKKKIVTFFGSEKDEEDWRAFLLEFQGNLDQLSSILRAKSDPYQSYGAAGANYVWYMLGSKSNLRSDFLTYLVVHENVHVIQSALTPTGYPYRLYYGPDKELTGADLYLPLLFIEGHADLITYNIAFSNSESSKQLFIERARDWSSGLSGRRTQDPRLQTAEQVVTYFKNWEDPLFAFAKQSNGEFRSAASMYHNGVIVLNALVAVKGYSAMHEFFILVKSGVPYREAFLKSFGLSTDDFYREIAPYLIAVRKQLGLSSE